MALSKEMILTLKQLNGIGNKTIFKICESVKSSISDVDEVYDVLKRQKGKKFESLTKDDIIEANGYTKRILEKSKEADIGLISYYDTDYPDILKRTIDEEGKLDPPLLLWYRGDISIIGMPAIAVIGTREATPEGISGGTYIAGEFAKRGFNIVSGLAIGCDTCGHRGALKVGGKTTAFLANGLDRDSIYPAENQDLAEEIVDNGGLLLSEYPIEQTVNRYSLVARDRLQAGLSLATVVIQTGIKGGTMHAATTTLKAGKPLYAMKFKDESTNNHEKCLGNALLVKKGAKYISGNDNIADIVKQIMSVKEIKTSLFD